MFFETNKTGSKKICYSIQTLISTKTSKKDLNIF